MANPFVHVELNTTDLNKAKGFYTKLFNWTLEEFPSGNHPYTIIKVGEGTGGGMMPQMMPGETSAWMPYVLVEDVKSSTKNAQTLGAKIIKDVTEVPGMGWFSIIADPTGAILGLWQTNM